MACCTSALGAQVEVRGGLVEQQDGRVDQQRAGQADELALAGRQRPAPLGDRVQVAAAQRGDELVGADGARGRSTSTSVASGRP